MFIFQSDKHRAAFLNETHVFGKKQAPIVEAVVNESVAPKKTLSKKVFILLPSLRQSFFRRSCCLSTLPTAT
jgi:hypothetical protein